MTDIEAPPASKPLPPGAVVAAGDLVEAAGHPVGSGAIKPGYDPRLTNEDLAPLREQTWSSYNIFAFWMSDVHSVGGYVTAGSLFALGLASWQVLIALLAGIVIVNVFCNLVAKPSQVTGVPYPVINRAVFGVRGANIPALVRGVIAIAWYGVQTYLASQALIIVFLKFWPATATLNDTGRYGFLGLSVLGYICYAILWVAQAVVFWKGMEAIRRFIDWAGPAVYVVMVVLAVYLVAKARADGRDHASGPPADPLRAEVGEVERRGDEVGHDVDADGGDDEGQPAEQDRERRVDALNRVDRVGDELAEHRDGGRRRDHGQQREEQEVDRKAEQVAPLHRLERAA